jgi:hypothetical protein
MGDQGLDHAMERLYIPRNFVSSFLSKLALAQKYV